MILISLKNEAIDKIKSGQDLTGKDGILTPLIKEILDAALDGELDSHLAESKTEGQSNRRNGNLKKVMKTGTGTFELETPRDREGSFEPEIVKKRLLLQCGATGRLMLFIQLFF